jgi:hypothetical protein
VYYYNNRKKARENDVTSGHVTGVTSGYITSSHVISCVVSSGSITFKNKDILIRIKQLKLRVMKETICTTTIVKKNRGEMTSLPVMKSLPITSLMSLPVT